MLGHPLRRFFATYKPSNRLARNAIPRHIFSGRAIGAVVAQQLYTLWVGGSNPSSPTKVHFETRRWRFLKHTS
jgi:hypothetical protein